MGKGVGLQPYSDACSMNTEWRYLGEWSAAAVHATPLFMFLIGCSMWAKNR